MKSWKERMILRDRYLLEVYIKLDWDKIMTAKEASLKLGKNEKYVYLLWKNNSDSLLENSVSLKGKTLLISEEGFEHLQKQQKQQKKMTSEKMNEIYA